MQTSSCPYSRSSLVLRRGLGPELPFTAGGLSGPWLDDEEDVLAWTSRSGSTDVRPLLAVVWLDNGLNSGNKTAIDCQTTYGSYLEILHIFSWLLGPSLKVAFLYQTVNQIGIIWYTQWYFKEQKIYTQISWGSARFFQEECKMQWNQKSISSVQSDS